MRDLDIRAALRTTALAGHVADPSTAVIDELGICRGATRADIVVVNGEMHAYEIKSAEDTLRRLPTQIKHYSTVFDRVTLVVATAHFEEAGVKLPAWWGVVVASGSASRGIQLHHHRDAQSNPDVNVRAAAELLWRDDVIRLLAARDVLRGVASKPRAALWDRLCANYGAGEVLAEVRAALKSRATPALDPPRP